MHSNIMVEDNIIERAMSVSGIKTKKEMVETALRAYVEFHSRRDLSELKGQIQFANGYDYKALREEE